VDGGATHRLDLLVQLADELSPVLEADLKDLALLNLRNLDEIKVRIEQKLLVLLVLDELEVLAEEVREEESEVVDELLVGIGRLVVGAGDVCGRERPRSAWRVADALAAGGARTCRRRDHLVDRGHDHLEEDDKLGVVLWHDLEAANLGQALERDVAEVGDLKEL
jgi:hypothetical protein